MDLSLLSVVCSGGLLLHYLAVYLLRATCVASQVGFFFENLNGKVVVTAIGGVCTADVRVGDVVVSVNGEVPTDARHAWRLSQDRDSGLDLEVEVAPHQEP